MSQLTSFGAAPASGEFAFRINFLRTFCYLQNYEGGEKGFLFHFLRFWAEQHIYHQNLLKLQLWIMNRAIHPWGELSCARSTLIRLKIYHRQYYAFNQRCRICECYWYNPYFSQNGWRLLHQKMPEMVAPFFTRSSSSKWAPRAPRAWTSAVRLLKSCLQ